MISHRTIYQSTGIRVLPLPPTGCSILNKMKVLPSKTVNSRRYQMTKCFQGDLRAHNTNDNFIHSWSFKLLLCNFNNQLFQTKRVKRGEETSYTTEEALQLDIHDRYSNPHSCRSATRIMNSTKRKAKVLSNKAKHKVSTASLRLPLLQYCGS